MTNIYNLFKFLEDKKGRKVPFRLKLIHAPETLSKEDLNVEYDFDLINTPITSLPDNLKVRGNLYLTRTKITSLPDNLKVGGDLTVNSTPLIGKYSREEIRKTIEDKGGYVRGRIIIF